MTPAIASRPSPNWDPRPASAAIDCLVIHYTGMRGGDAALERLTDPDSKVSAHYLIDEDGGVFQMVEDHGRAWHAGVSSWQGRTRINDCSIGIELVNPGHEWGYRPFFEAQYQALERLAADLMKRWSIPPSRVLAHSDIAPDRKEDPGELFDWRRLARRGIGIWPADGEGRPRPLAVAQKQLRHIGYEVPTFGDLDEPTRQVLIAFQRHFRPERIDGELDRVTLARLDGLLELALID